MQSFLSFQETLNHMNSKVIRSLAESIRLIDRQREIIVGLLLGDGHLETQNKGRTFRLKVEHSIRQKDYVDWLYKQLSNMVLTKPQLKLQTVAGKEHEKYWFSTISTGALRFYAGQFYADRKKIVPKMIAKLVTPLSLAVWFMDDGSLKSRFHRARIINTHCFDGASLQRLQDMLHKNFHIHTTLRKQREGTQLYIPSTDIATFITAIKPYIHPTMEYKIKLT